MRTLVLVLLLVPALSGCLSNDSSTDGMAGADGITIEAPADPIHYDETFDLRFGGMDETWSWTMTEGMTGKLQILYGANPSTVYGKQTVCYKLEWPEGSRNGGGNCVPSNTAITVSANPSTDQGYVPVYETYMQPNDFQLRVWTPKGPDTAHVHVKIQTFAATSE